MSARGLRPAAAIVALALAATLPSWGGSPYGLELGITRDLAGDLFNDTFRLLC